MPGGTTCLRHAVLIVFLVASVVGADERASPSSRVTPTVRAVSRVMPSVVNLSTEKLVERSDYNRNPFVGESLFFGDRLGELRQPVHSLGSGAIIDPAGIIVTNCHVVQRAFRIHVTLSDGRRFLAHEIASADQNDIALLRIIDLPEGENLVPIPFAKAGDLYLGETVIAVGNPYGLGNSIACGVLSAIGRKVVHEGSVVLPNILQVDAAINPGNSGGPLINLDAEMIGVNIASHREAVGIGFAIPLERVENLIGKWLVPERFGNFSLGIVPGIRVLAPGNVEVIVAEVLRDSPAWRQGIRSGEAIAELDGETVESLIQVSRKLWHLNAGKTVTLTLNGGKQYPLKVEEIPFTDGKTIARIRLGLGLQTLSPSLAEALGYPFGRGIIVSDLLSSLPGIKRGDVLVRLGDVPVYSLQDIAHALRDVRYGDAIQAVFVSVVPKGDSFYLVKHALNLTVK